MAGTTITGFRGELPAVHPSLLPDSAAAIARDCRIVGGKLLPLRGLTTVQAKTVAGTPLSIYKYNNAWFEWNTDVDVVTALAANDAFDRRIYTGDGVPRVTYNTIATSTPPYPSVSRDLGVPPPATAPTVVVSGTATDPADTPEQRGYVVTLTDEFGAEGPPSPLSNIVTWRPGQTVTVTLPALPSGNRIFTAKNVYRSNTGSTDTALQYVQSTGSAAATYVDTVPSSSLSEVLVTEDFDLPPAGLKGIISLPNGGHAAFYSNVLCFDEPGFPHAWPVKYQLPTAQPIVAIKAFGANIVVMTESIPYIASGAHPGSMVLEEVELPQACVSKRGVVDMGYGVVYPSPDGLVMISTAGPRLITEGVFSRDEWQAVSPATLTACYWEGLYLAFYGGTGGFAFNPKNPEAGVVWFTTHATAVFVDELTDKIYMAVGNNIVEWDSNAAAPFTYQWRSRHLLLSSPKNVGALRVRADAYPVTLRLYSTDNVLRHTLVAANAKTRRGADGYRAAGFYVDVQGTAPVTEVGFGEVMGDV